MQCHTILNSWQNRSRVAFSCWLYVKLFTISACWHWMWDIQEIWAHTFNQLAIEPHRRFGLTDEVDRSRQHLIVQKWHHHTTVQAFELDFLFSSESACPRRRHMFLADINTNTSDKNITTIKQIAKLGSKLKNGTRHLYHPYVKKSIGLFEEKLFCRDGRCWFMRRAGGTLICFVRLSSLYRCLFSN